MSYIPDDDKARKMTPLFKYFTRYFPKAHREVAKVCVVNNVRYSPDREPADINWNRGKSPDQLGSAFRHMLESAIDGKVFEAVPAEVAKLTGIEKVYVLAEAMWRIGAELELTIEKEEAKGKVTVHVPYQYAAKNDEIKLHRECPMYWGDPLKHKCILPHGHDAPHLFAGNPDQSLADPC